MTDVLGAGQLAEREVTMTELKIAGTMLAVGGPVVAAAGADTDWTAVTLLVAGIGATSLAVVALHKALIKSVEDRLSESERRNDECEEDRKALWKLAAEARGEPAEELQSKYRTSKRG